MWDGLHGSTVLVIGTYVSHMLYKGHVCVHYGANKKKKVGFFERSLVKYCEVIRKKRVQNLSAIKVYLEVAQVDFMLPLD